MRERVTRIYINLIHLNVLSNEMVSHGTIDWSSCVQGERRERERAWARINWYDCWRVTFFLQISSLQSLQKGEGERERSLRVALLVHKSIYKKKKKKNARVKGKKKMKKEKSKESQIKQTLRNRNTNEKWNKLLSNSYSTVHLFISNSPLYNARDTNGE